MYNKNYSKLFGSFGIWLLFALCNGNFLEENYPKSVVEDCKLDTAELIEKYNYRAETHFATTEDNYIIRMHRIANPGGHPVLLMHGLLDCSATWILHGPEKSLGYLLADNGYDVWIGNARGNRYSRNHTTLDPSADKEFWTFSWHEIGYYDLPAMIDHVLEETKYKKLGYFGHSQGTISFFVMASMRPDYNSKITMMHALGPVAFMNHMTFPLRGVIQNYLKTLKGQLLELLPHSKVVLDTCVSSQSSMDMCLETSYQFLGKNPKQLNMTMLPVLFANLPAGCNVKQVEHFMQLTKSGRFCQYDYGAEENMKKYAMEEAPNYPLEKITAPVGLYYAANDHFANVIDVERLADELPNVVENCLYPYEDWVHVDMLWGIDARELAHRRMLEIMKKYSYDI